MGETNLQLLPPCVGALHTVSHVLAGLGKASREVVQVDTCRYCLLHAATHVASAVWRMLPGYIPALGTAYGNLHPIAHFFDSVTEMLVFLSLSHLAEGIIKAQSGAFRFHLLLKVSRCLVVFTLGCLVAAALVLYIVVENSGLYRAIDDNCSYYSWCYWYEYDFPTILYTALKIDVAFTAIVWIMSLGLTAWSVLIAYRCNGEKRVARVCISRLSSVGCSANPSYFRRPSTSSFAAYSGSSGQPTSWLWLCAIITTAIGNTAMLTAVGVWDSLFAMFLRPYGPCLASWSSCTCSATIVTTGSG